MGKKQIVVHEGLLDEHSSMSSMYNGELEIDDYLVEEILIPFKGKKVRLTLEVLED